MSNSVPEACYTYFSCKEKDCIRRDYPSKNCWEIDDVRCHSHSEGFKQIKNQLKSKLEACKLCIYYQVNH